MELWHFLGDWHPKLVQFPLVLLLTGLLFDLAGLFFRSTRAHWAALMLTGAGTLGLLFAFICGIYAEIWAGRAGIPHHPIELHELMANISSWGFVLLFAWRILLAEPGSKNSPLQAHLKNLRWLRLYTCIGLAWYLFLVVTAYLGGRLVFEYGAGVTGAGVNNVLTLEDLNTLATRQTDENLRYSEWMHHVFGIMTLGLAASLLAQVAFPKAGPRLRWIVPTFFLAGGVFLFFMADRDLYALTDWRQLRDREVQLHKSLAIIMGVVGVAGLWKLKSKKTESSSPLPSTGLTANELRQSNSKLVAIMALIGGALLFTHVHTVAPYANVAAGVYIAHVVMGVVALSIGATRLMQDYLPRWRKGLAFAFALFMGAEAVLLITYNEGLPWFIGYGTYNRWGPLHDILPDERDPVTVAPFGEFRALLLVNQEQGDLFVAFRHRYTNDSVVLTLDSPPQLLLGRGNSEIVVPLMKSSADTATPEERLAAATWKDLTSSTFQGHASFVQNTPYLSARLLLTIKGRQHIGYFDPWVTPAISAVPPNKVAQYQCPMHDAIRAEAPGKCGLCGMNLLPIRPALPPGQLHDSKYSLKVSVEKAEEGNPRTARLILGVMDADKQNVPLAEMHEQLMHVIIASEDLSYFDHVHPVPVLTTPDPVTPYRIIYPFPRPGRYILFADLMPASDRGQVFRVALEVDDSGVHLVEKESRHTALIADVATTKLVAPVTFPRTPQESAPLDMSTSITGNIEAQLIRQPRTLYAGLPAQLVVRLADAQGKPITDLSPYLGAAGHCVIISDDTRTFIHSHPEQYRPTQPDDTYGPAISFHATFPTAGTYRIWAQFKRGNQLIIAPFTIKVENPPVPASWMRFLLNE